MSLEVILHAFQGRCPLEKCELWSPEASVAAPFLLPVKASSSPPGRASVIVKSAAAAATKLEGQVPRSPSALMQATGFPDITNICCVEPNTIDGDSDISLLRSGRLEEADDHPKQR